MTQTRSKRRVEAELAFASSQTQFFARNKALDEQVSIAQSRAEKTARLRQAREEREAEVRSSVKKAILAKRAQA